jgi:uncharacterized membrane protein
MLAHLHPLLVHIPIGILLFAFLITLLPAKYRDGMATALSLALGVASIASLTACITGYLLAQSGDYDLLLVSKHQWLGIATCILCFSAWLITPYRKILVWITVMMMSIAAHFGGTLTHGEGYLFSSSENKTPAADTSNMPSDTLTKTISDTVLPPKQVAHQHFPYRDDIAPILQNKCYNCHSSIKKKNGLRLDTEDFILKGGKNGPILFPNNLQKSVLYTHLILPLEEEKHMPPKGKKQLNGHEIELIKQWILQGAPFNPITVSSTSIKVNPSANEVAIAPVQGEALLSITPTVPIKKASTKEILPGNATTIAQLKTKGIIITPITDSSAALSINFVHATVLEDSILLRLNALNNQAVVLKFSGKKITDDQLHLLASFNNVHTLYLDNTAITDKGLTDIIKFPDLEILNLYNTSISDRGLYALYNCKKLKKIYLWKTNVTQAGLNALSLQFPTLNIDAGLFTWKTPDSLKIK